MPPHSTHSPINVIYCADRISRSFALVHSALGPGHPPPHDACCSLHSPQLNADNVTKPAERIVPLMGGRDKVLTAANEAMENKEYAWAAQLVNYLYRLDPEDAEVRQAKAGALRQMAYVSTGANDRAHLMSQALALEDKVTIPRVVPPASEVIAASPTSYVDYFRVRIDPEKSGETDKVMRFDFPGGSSAGLHIRRAVAEFLPSPADHYRAPDVVLAMSGETWAKLFVSQATPEELMGSGEIEVTGDATEAARLINLFDRYVPEKAVVVPPAAFSSQR